jgi:hypothetical protein
MNLGVHLFKGISFTKPNEVFMGYPRIQLLQVLIGSRFCLTTDRQSADQNNDHNYFYRNYFLRSDFLEILKLLMG